MRRLLAFAFVVSVPAAVGCILYSVQGTGPAADTATDRPAEVAGFSSRIDSPQPAKDEESPEPAVAAAAAAPEPGPEVAPAVRAQPSDGEAVSSREAAEAPRAAEVFQSLTPVKPALPETVAAEPEQPRQAAAAEPGEPPAPVKIKVVVTGHRVNVRERPDETSRWLASHVRDTELELIERQGDWIQIRHGETQPSGWMHGKYLKELPQETERQSLPAG